MTAKSIPAFARGVRLRTQADEEPHLLIPEGFLNLNATAAAALALVDGERSVAQIAAVLHPRFSSVEADALERDVADLFEALRDRALIVYR